MSYVVTGTDPTLLHGGMGLDPRRLQPRTPHHQGVERRAGARVRRSGSPAHSLRTPTATPHCETSDESMWSRPSDSDKTASSQRRDALT